ncbi:MAG: ABC transporter substrate-binding protein [Chloroflexota bacterium]|nr:ABC transporter substrate-binding protein [Chloroflexota bacterium]
MLCRQRGLLVSLLLLVALLLAACGGAAPVAPEEAGEAVDEAVEEVVEEPAETTEEEVEEPAEEMAEEELGDEETPEDEEVETPETEGTTEEEAAGDMTGEPYRIGIAVAATGGAATLGVPERLTAEMIAEQLSETGITGPDGVTHPVEFVIYDTESNPDTAASVMSRLINEDQVDIVVGGSTTGESLAMVPIATENATPFISMGSAGEVIVDPQTGETRTWIFKTPHINTHVAAWHSQYLQDQGIDSVCYLYENTGYGQDVLNTGTAAMEEAGIEVAYSDAFERSDTEFPQIASVQSSGCQAVVVGSLMPGAVNVMGAIRDFMPDVPVLHSGGICNEAFLTLDPAVTEGALVTCPKLLVPDEIPEDDPQYEVLQEYIQEYQTFSGEPADAFGGHAYDALQWAIMAMESLEGDMTLEERRAAIRDALESEVNEWPGTGGVFTLEPDDHLGVKDYTTALTMTRVEDGDFTFFPPEEWGE